MDAPGSRPRGCPAEPPPRPAAAETGIARFPGEKAAQVELAERDVARTVHGVLVRNGLAREPGGCLAKHWDGKQVADLPQGHPCLMLRCDPRARFAASRLIRR